jgi:hypothetical protein
MKLKPSQVGTDWKDTMKTATTSTKKQNALLAAFERTAKWVASKAMTTRQIKLEGAIRLVNLFISKKAEIATAKLSQQDVASKSGFESAPFECSTRNKTNRLIKLGVVTRLWAILNADGQTPENDSQWAKAIKECPFTQDHADKLMRGLKADVVEYCDPSHKTYAEIVSRIAMALERVNAGETIGDACTAISEENAKTPAPNAKAKKAKKAKKGKTRIEATTIMGTADVVEMLTKGAKMGDYTTADLESIRDAVQGLIDSGPTDADLITELSDSIVDAVSEEFGI